MSDYSLLIGAGKGIRVLTKPSHGFLAEFRQQTLLDRVLNYGLAVVAVALAFGFRMALTAWVGPGLPTYITFYPAVMLAALLGGFGPGVAATALTGIAVAYWILPPIGQFDVTSPAERLGLVIFTCMGLSMSILAGLYRRNRDKVAAYDREAALRESQARLATFAEATFEGIAESEAGRIVDCNEQFARMLGYTIAELKGMEISDLIAPEDQDRTMENVAQGQESLIEHTMLRKDGARIIIEAHGRSLAPGSTKRHFAVRDITERRRVEEALRLAHDEMEIRIQERTREIEQANQELQVQVAERTRAETRVREAAERVSIILKLYTTASHSTDNELYGYVLEQVVKLTSSEIGFFHLVSEDQESIALTTWNKASLDHCTAVYETHYPITDAGNWVDCVRLKHPVIYNDFSSSPNQKGLPEGHTPIKRFMSIPVMEEDKVRMIIGVGNKAQPYEKHDVTQLQLVANELQKIVRQRHVDEALMLKNTVFDESLSANLVADAKRRITEVNASFLHCFGYDMKQELAGSLISDLFSDSEEANDFFSELDKRALWEGVLLAKRKDGSDIIAQGSATILRDKQGALAGYQASFIDITESIRAEETLDAQRVHQIRSDRLGLLGQMAGGIAHELNQPLVGVRGCAQHLLIAMERGWDLSGGKIQERLKTIVEQSDRMTHVIQHVRMFAREAGNENLTLVDVNEVLNSSIILLAEQLKAHGVELEFDLAPSTPSVLANPFSLEEVFINIVLNARDAVKEKMASGSECDCRVILRSEVPVGTSDEGYVKVQIVDFGCGIPDNLLNRIFEPFMTTKDPDKGTGLGLAISKSIIESIGGRIEVESVRNEGTTITVLLPIKTQDFLEVI